MNMQNKNSKIIKAKEFNIKIIDKDTFYKEYLE